MIFTLLALFAAQDMGAAAPVAVVNTDPRAAVIEMCTAEARRRALARGATDVSMAEVKDTDLKSDGRASMTAKMNLVITDSKGKTKTQTKKVQCDTQKGVITRFKVG